MALFAIDGARDADTLAKLDLFAKQTFSAKSQFQVMHIAQPSISSHDGVLSAGYG